MKIWTLATDGDNSPLEVTVHPTEETALCLLRAKLAAEVSPRKLEIQLDSLNAMDFDHLEECWREMFDGVCSLQGHDVDWCRFV